MMTIDVIVTRLNDRSPDSEWGDLWGFQNQEFCKAYGDDREVSTDLAAASLIVLRGGATGIGRHFREKILPHLTDRDIRLFFHGEDHDRKDFFGDKTVTLLTYSLGERNQDPDSTGKDVKRYAEKLNGDVSGTPGGGNASKPTNEGDGNPLDDSVERLYMRRFFSLIVPSCLADEKKIKDWAIEELRSLSEVAQRTIVRAVRKEARLRCALGDLVENKKWEELMAWVSRHGLTLPSLARRYL